MIDAKRLDELFALYCRTFSRAMLGQQVNVDQTDLLEVMSVAFAVEDAKRPSGWDGIHSRGELRIRLHEHLTDDVAPPGVDLSHAEIRELAEVVGGLKGQMHPLRLRLLAHLPESEPT